jgi:hypothetical protein
VARATRSARGEEALALRNRAFWDLHDTVAEIGAAGRYLHRGDPRLRALFQIPTEVNVGRPRLRRLARELGAEREVSDIARG